MANIERARREHTQAELDAHAAHLRGEGWGYDQIAEAMGCSKSTVYARVTRSYGRMAGPKAAERRRAELTRLEEYELAIMKVLDATHFAISNGRVVTLQLPDGTRIPVPDHGPVLEAVKTGLQIMSRRAALEGYDAPRKTRVEVITKDVLDAEIERLEREHAEKVAADDPGELYDREELAEP